MLVVVAVVAVAVGRSYARSPAEIAADSKPPPRSTLTAAVERRTLEVKVVTRATVVAAGVTDVDCHPGTAQSATGGRQVFTRRPPGPGATMNEGQLLAEVNGRPVILLQGDVPAYRDLVPGAKGADVGALQAALARLGFDPGERESTLGKGTQAAVAAWYRSLGYEPAGPTKDESAALDAANTAMRAAVGAQRDAEAALREAAKGADNVEVLQAQVALAQVQQELDKARAAKADTSLLELQVRAARATLDRLLAPPDTSVPRRALDDANAALADARNRQATLDASTGVMVPFCEVVFVPGLPVIVDQPPTGGSGGGNSGGNGGAGDGGAGNGGSWARLASGQLAVQGRVKAGERDLVQVGMAATFGDGQAGKVAAVDPSAGESGEASVTVNPDQALAADALGRNVRLAIPVKSTNGDVLVVPLSAVTAAAEGSARVTAVGPSGEIAVAVRAGLTAGGFVEVAPVRDGSLQPGDRVVIGR